MPELPEVQAHAERLTAQFAGTKLKKFVPLTFTALKTALPRPDAAYGLPLESVGRRGKYLLLRFEPVTFIVHLMQGGRLLVDEKQSAKPRNGQARFVFADAPALLLTEAGTERRAGVWCIANDELDGPPLNRLGPEALDVTAQSLAESFKTTNMRIHGYLRDQHEIAGTPERMHSPTRVRQHDSSAGGGHLDHVFPDDRRHHHLSPVGTRVREAHGPARWRNSADPERSLVAAGTSEPGRRRHRLGGRAYLGRAALYNAAAVRAARRAPDPGQRTEVDG